MLTVACVLKDGGVYTPAYVRHLHTQVERHLSIPHKFVALTDVQADFPQSCEVVPLHHNLPGWWSKIELFMLDGSVIYFDLDTCIFDNLDEFALNCASLLSGGVADMLMLRDFNWPRPGFGYASGIMAWSQRNLKMLGRCTDEAMRSYKWDQRYIEAEAQRQQLKVMPVQDVLSVSSYKYHCKDQKPNGSAVICFHGKPKPHEVGGVWWEGNK